MNVSIVEFISEQLRKLWLLQNIHVVHLYINLPSSAYMCTAAVGGGGDDIVVVVADIVVDC